ncbi:hypothetical protein BZG36_00216 [Bifiguratus adelaidae]|uniref:CDP-diacylglycerol--glycerol-3-phosphate 3-phosphatidyltransferase n=1 Tax=Bifiguratus adelaidae TaxID=1938954 RepID=A0A261Y8F5_9FUNG|nr:hypothetical protein BZG36_00216 [Bifiguratus adelaidae]
MFTKWSALSRPLVRLHLTNVRPIALGKPRSVTTFQNFRELRAITPAIGSQIRSAKERIYLAALYIGAKEKDLVDTIAEAMRENSSLECSILIDGLRGTRLTEGKSSASLVLPLLQEFPSRVHIHLYHTPDLSGWLKKLLPQRFNEGIGLMHLKIYGVDNDVMLSGANMSTDYFTNRQDRYILYRQNPTMASYFLQLLKVVSSFSYRLIPDFDASSYKLEMQHTPDPIKESTAFKAVARSRVSEFIRQWMKRQQENDIASSDTVVLPVVQMGPFGIRQDEQAIFKLLEICDAAGSNAEASQSWKIHLTSGYFNFTKELKSKILSTRAKFHFLTASPKANGFYGSKGVSKYLPDAYTSIEHDFFQATRQLNKGDSIKISEYTRPGWTYHAKGLWLQLPGMENPAMTLVGSPNFGYRSSERDLEAQVIMVTDNAKLQESLGRELANLHTYSEQVDEKLFKRPDRKVPFLVKITARIIRDML